MTRYRSYSSVDRKPCSTSVRSVDIREIISCCKVVDETEAVSTFSGHEIVGSASEDVAIFANDSGADTNSEFTFLSCKDKVKSMSQGWTSLTRTCFHAEEDK